MFSQPFRCTSPQAPSIFIPIVSDVDSDPTDVLMINCGHLIVHSVPDRSETATAASPKNRYLVTLTSMSVEQSSVLLNNRSSVSSEATSFTTISNNF